MNRDAEHIALLNRFGTILHSQETLTMEQSLSTMIMKAVEVQKGDFVESGERSQYQLRE